MKRRGDGLRLIRALLPEERPRVDVDAWLAKEYPEAHARRNLDLLAISMARRQFEAASRPIAFRVVRLQFVRRGRAGRIRRLKQSERMARYVRAAFEAKTFDRMYGVPIYVSQARLPRPPRPRRRLRFRST